MPTPAYDLISTTTLGSAQNAISVSSIPATYTDLRITLFVPNNSGAGQDVGIQFNSDTGSNYWQLGYNQNNSNGSNAVNYGTGNTRVWINNQTIYTYTAYPSFFTLDLMAYANTNFPKEFFISAQNSTSNTDGNLSRNIALWNSNNAINALNIFCGGTVTFGVDTVLKIYGITKA